MIKHLFNYPKLALAAAVSLQLGSMALAGTVVIQPLTEAESKDAKIYNHQDTLSLASNLAIYDIGAGAHFLSLVQFDLSTLQQVIAQQGSVDRVVLRLFVSAAPAAPASVTVSPILNAWRENESDPGDSPLSTYRAFFGATVDGNPVLPTLFHDDMAKVTVPVTASGYCELDITAIALQWLNGTLANNGLLIQTTTPAAIVQLADVDSNGSENAPALFASVTTLSEHYADAAGNAYEYYLSIGQTNLAYSAYYDQIALALYNEYLAQGDQANALLAYFTNKGKALKFYQLSRKNARLGRFMELKNLALGYKQYFTLLGQPKKGQAFYARYMRMARNARA